MKEVKSFDDFKEDLIEGEIKGLDNLNDIDEICDFAKNNGYDFKKEDLEDSEFLDDILDCVAGGKDIARSNF